MVARLESSRDIDCIANKLEALDYEVILYDKEVAFIYRKRINSSQLKRDVDSAKDACKHSHIIKMTYGTSSMNI